MDYSPNNYVNKNTFYFFNKFYNYIPFVQVGIVALGVIKSMYEMDKKCRIKK